MAFDETFLVGSTGKTIDVMLVNPDTGLGATGINPENVVGYYVRSGSPPVEIVFSSSNFSQIDSTAVPGLYRITIPNGALAEGAEAVTIYLRGTSNQFVPRSLRICLLSANLRDSTRLGLSALPSAGAGTNGGLPTVDANNAVKVQSGNGANQIALSAGAVTVNSVSSSVTSDIAASVWNRNTGDINTANSIGLQVKTNLDTPVSSRSTFNSASQPVIVGSISNDAITAAAVAQSAVDEISSGVWDKSTGSIVTNGSIGLQVKTNLDTPVSSRSTFNPSSQSVTVGAVNNNAITSSAIQNNAITVDKIADNAITSAKLANNAITVDKIADNAITSAKLANSAITSAKLANSAITVDKIADNTITVDKIANNAINASKIADGALTDTKFSLTALASIASSVWDRLTSLVNVTGSIGKWLIDNITTLLSNVQSVVDMTEVTGTPNYRRYKANALEMAPAPQGGSTAEQIWSYSNRTLSGPVSVSSISNNAITADSIATNAITGDKIADNAVTKIQNGLATATELNKVPKSDGTAVWNTSALNAIKTQAASALNDYDPPTKAEMDSAIAPLALEATLQSIKGTGWSSQTLVAIANAIASLNNISQAQVESALSSVLNSTGYTNTRAQRLDNIDARISDVKAKTDNIPTNPASAQHISTLESLIGGVQSSVDVVNGTLQEVDNDVYEKVGTPPNEYRRLKERALENAPRGYKTW